MWFDNSDFHADTRIIMSNASHVTTLFVTYGRPQDLPVGRMPTPLQAVLAYWRERIAGRRAPTWRDIDPFSELPQVAPSMMLWQTTGDEHGYVCTRAGAAVCEIAGRDLHGITLAEMCFDNLQAARQEFDGVTETLLAHYVERSMGWGRQSGRTYSRLLLPLSEDGRSASMLWSTIVLV
jgi:hypothetical protein